MKNKHTLGPWIVWDGDIAPQSDATNPIATLYQDTSDADAHLIAAAPELMEALEGMVRMSVASRTDDRIAHDRAVKAIAKARGQS